MNPLRALLGLGVLGLLLSGCASPRGDTKASAAASGSVLVVRRGWHVDVGFAVRDLQGPLAGIGGEFPQARYIFFGFGDERYVRAKHHRLPSLMSAVWPGRGVMLVTAIENTPRLAFGRDSVIAIPLDAVQRDTLQRAVADSFESLSQGQSPPIQGPYADSLYYGSSARYSGLHTCNTWAAEMLRSAGLPVRNRGVVLAGQLWRQIRPLARAGAD